MEDEKRLKDEKKKEERRRGTRVSYLIHLSKIIFLSPFSFLFFYLLFLLQNRDNSFRQKLMQNALLCDNYRKLHHFKNLDPKKENEKEKERKREKERREWRRKSSKEMILIEENNQRHRDKSDMSWYILLISTNISS